MTDSRRTGSSAVTRNVPLDDALVTRALRALQRTAHLGDPIRLQFWEVHGLTMPQVKLMVLLAEQDQQTLGELAQQLEVSPATVTGLTDRLSKQGLIERRHDTRDRRVIRAALTPHGAHVAHESMKVGRAYFTQIFEAIGEENVQAFVSALGDFLEAAASVSVNDFLTGDNADAADGNGEAAAAIESIGAAGAKRLITPKREP